MTTGQGRPEGNCGIVGFRNAMDSLQLEKLSFWLCSCLKAPLSLRVMLVRIRL
ncbi:hypothetical protein Pmar_PMAR006739 [Perkinsus marinus ATCC 50983]|uniref:Uncharacterized protein n=1 Tax=Perkinsus marinus (strain ATCC 50983 / TXsc) TaxID=423536 RepID=C5K6C6_PERM5|nr:hypothetical protein Pmar_PMAR006739 [Perkinsus marinus ATCC 50983]EER19846.1 hypothetical protein Pmar_PMAR006739 [Perkinsus marinus ATCC 50983]|eukprot:XP_002788050.1 hypothetical protein Pmar_PMAR006739 [Perkinsus marinus ATCC 50983]